MASRRIPTPSEGRLRPVYLGTSPFAATVLRRLAASAHVPALVITPPDSRSGRGRRPHPPAVAEAARELELKLHQAESVNDPDVLKRIRAAEADVGAVCAFGQLIREPLLSELELLNVHPSLLPRWRGAAPIERAILAGDERTGVTILRVTAGLDSGPIALAEPAEIAGRNYRELASELADRGAELLVRALDLATAGALSFTEQDEDAASYAEKIDRSERRLDPERPAVELERVVRALTPHVGAYVELGGGERLRVHAARARLGELPPGRLEDGGDALLLGCGEGVLELTGVHPAGGRPMQAADYLRGHPLPRLA